MVIYLDHHRLLLQMLQVLPPNTVSMSYSSPSKRLSYLYPHLHEESKQKSKTLASVVVPAILQLETIYLAGVGFFGQDDNGAWRHASLGYGNSSGARTVPPRALIKRLDVDDVIARKTPKIAT